MGSYSEMTETVGCMAILSIPFLLLTGSVIVLKRCWLLKLLERSLKPKMDKIKQWRKRRFVDYMNDPVLMLDLEQKLLRRFNGDQQRVLEYIEDIKSSVGNYHNDGAGSNENVASVDNNANINREYDEEENNSGNTKGEEKKEAAKWLLTGNIMVCLLLLVAGNFGVWTGLAHVWSFMLTDDYYGTCSIGFHVVTFVLFVAVQTIDSYLIYSRAFGIGWWRRVTDTRTEPMMNGRTYTECTSSNNNNNNEVNHLKLEMLPMGDKRPSTGITEALDEPLLSEHP